MKVLITGATGFIGANLQSRLAEMKNITTIPITRQSTQEELKTSLKEADLVFHLAGVNRPKDNHEFLSGNTHFTETLVDLVIQNGQPVPIVFTSSTQAEIDNPYGKSKLAAEAVLYNFQKEQNNPVNIVRLPNVFGKWCKPNYNSAIATFCSNLHNGLPLQINDANACLQLLYIDDLVNYLISLLETPTAEWPSCVLEPFYTATVGEVATLLQKYQSLSTTPTIEPVGDNFARTLYATFLSYKSKEYFSYPLPTFEDDRGMFAEVIRAGAHGQFSFFTAGPGVTRGGHYHHTKSERFLVVAGTARFQFRHILTREEYSIQVSSGTPTIVETVPGWAHDITNTGDDELIALLWANEVFDKEIPDTYRHELSA